MTNTSAKTGLKPGLRVALSLLGGALLPLSLAPLAIWPLSILCPALLGGLLQQGPQNRIWQTSFLFGLGMFATGASWVYVSIHDFGYTGVPLALILTGMFVAGLALVFSGPFLLLKFVSPNSALKFLLGFAGVWVLGEWLRSWFLTGFPWLYIGYSQLETPLAGWAPILGVFGLSLITALTAITLAGLILVRPGKPRLALVGICLLLWASGYGLTSARWTTAAGAPQSVALVQANIPQDKKWKPEFRLPTLRLYRSMTLPLADHDWIVWPEAAIPSVYSQAKSFLLDVDQFASESQSAVITGIIYDNTETGHYHNSAVALGAGSGKYHKTRLVPFGEYVPLEKWLRGTIEFFNLPMSMIRPGASEQPLLTMGDYQTGMAICYEIVYPDLVAQRASDSHVITTLSNDAWFGSSWGPLQHLQMAQMRALETGRYVIRSTNNGVSAIIKPDGSLATASQQFVRETISGSVIPMTGTTPFVQTGSFPTIIFSLTLLSFALWRVRQH